MTDAIACRMIKKILEDEKDAGLEYSHLKSKLKNPQDKQTMEDIRDDEVRHYKIIKEMHGRIC
jgi:rubrerythrin